MPIEVIEEEDDCIVDDDAELQSTDAESFHDSDYDFSKDEDDVIFQKAVASTEKEVKTDQKIGKTLAGGETQGNKNNATKPTDDAIGKTAACKQESSKNGADQKRGETLADGETNGSQNNATKPTVDALGKTAACKQESCKKGAPKDDWNLYGGDPIVVHEESATMNTEDLNSCCESSDEDSLRMRKPRYIRFRPEIDMPNQNSMLGYFSIINKSSREQLITMV